MTDYRIQVRVKNNRILSLIEETHASAMAFAREHNINYTSLMQLISLRLPAKTVMGNWTKVVLDTAGALNKDPEELFTERQLAGLKTSTIIRNVSEEDIISLSDSETKFLLTDDHQDERIFANQMAGLVQVLPPRQRAIIQHRFGLTGAEEMTYDELGACWGVTKERIRQIEVSALRKLRQKVNQQQKLDNLKAASFSA
jgi:RNA polymerase sigma factor (sigma-70 family)